jgi:YidC/Oxa1 family membrane protein insertase
MLALSLNKRLYTLLLVMVLLVVAVSLTGCGASQGQIDLNKPNGVWEAFVFALALALRSLNHAIRGLGIPYSYGWAIIVFIVAVKLVTLPLTLRQLQSAKAMQELQPRLTELQRKYNKDPQKLSEEQMKLYKEAGMNPLGGCLPLLIQMPILFALYQSLYALANPSVGELKGQGFFWIPDLSFPAQATGMSWISTAFNSQHFGPLAAYLSLPVIMVVTQVILQKMSTPAPAPGQTKADDQQRMMSQMMMFTPIIFGYITLGLPSGLVLDCVQHPEHHPAVLDQRLGRPRDLVPCAQVWDKRASSHSRCRSLIGYKMPALSLNEPAVIIWLALCLILALAWFLDWRQKRHK